MKVVHSSFVSCRLCHHHWCSYSSNIATQTVTWITIAIGVLFFLSECFYQYFSAKSEQQRECKDRCFLMLTANRSSATTAKFPIVGLGSLILGIILALMPNVFISWLMFIHFGNSDSEAAITQMANLATAAKDGACGYHLLADAISSSAPGYTGYHQAFRLSLSPIAHHRLGHVGIRCSRMRQLASRFPITGR